MKMKKKSLFCLALALFFIAFSFPFAVSSENADGNADKLIALTFDDGPHPRYTNQILDILKDYGVRATFFEVGENVLYYRDTAIRVAREGHEIGNHTYSHPHLRGIDGVSLRNEVERCENAIKSVTGITPRLFRPPEGVVEDTVKVMAQEKEYSLVLWDVDTRDWAGRSSADIVNTVLENAKSGDVILMHDYISKKCHTVESLKVLIPALLRRGYTFVTVSELLERK